MGVKSFLDAKTRFRLLKKIFLNKKNIKVSKYEIKQEKSVYSIETIKYMIDNYKSFHLWNSYEEIKKLSTLVVVTRDGFEYEKKDDIRKLKVDMKISSTELRNTFNLKYIPKKIRKDVEKIWHRKGKN